MTHFYASLVGVSTKHSKFLGNIDRNLVPKISDKTIDILTSFCRTDSSLTPPQPPSQLKSQGEDLRVKLTPRPSKAILQFSPPSITCLFLLQQWNGKVVGEGRILMKERKNYLIFFVRLVSQLLLSADVQNNVTKLSFSASVPVSHA